MLSKIEIHIHCKYVVSKSKMWVLEKSVNQTCERGEPIRQLDLKLLLREILIIQ